MHLQFILVLARKTTVACDSEETTHSAEINDTSYERAACFHRDQANFF